MRLFSFFSVTSSSDPAGHQLLSLPPPAAPHLAADALHQQELASSWPALPVYSGLGRVPLRRVPCALSGPQGARRQAPGLSTTTAAAAAPPRRRSLLLLQHNKDLPPPSLPCWLLPRRRPHGHSTRERQAVQMSIS